MNRFAGKVALITGGSSGIGRATALAFAREGASLVIASRGAERGASVLSELKALGCEAEFVRADVSLAHDVEALVGQTLARFGRIDVAVNNAAAIDVGVFKPLTEYDEAEFEGHIAANLKSVWLCRGGESCRDRIDKGRGTRVRRREDPRERAGPWRVSHSDARARIRSHLARGSDGR